MYSLTKVHPSILCRRKCLQVDQLFHSPSLHHLTTILFPAVAPESRLLNTQHSAPVDGMYFEGIAEFTLV